MNKILVAILLVSAAIGIAMPAMADPFQDSLNSADASNWKNIGPINVVGTNTIANTVTQTLTSTGAQSNALGDVLAGSGDAINGAANALTASATSGGATSGGAASGTATSGGAGNTDTLTDASASDHSSVSGEASTEAETGDAKSKAETGSADSGDAKVKGIDQTAKANDNTVYSGDAKNKVFQINKVSQDAVADIHNNQKLVQVVKIKEFQKAKAETEPYVDFQDSILAENNGLDGGSKIQNED